MPPYLGREESELRKIFRIRMYADGMKRLLLVLWLGTLVGLLYAGGTRGQQADIEGLKAEINSLKTHRSDVESKLNSLSSAVDDLRRDRDNLKSQVDNLRSQLDSEHSKLDETTSKVNDTVQRSDIESVRSDFQNLQASLSQSLKRTAADIKKGEAANAGDINRLQADAATLAEANKAMEKALATLQKTQELHTARLEQVKKQTHIKAWVP